MKNRTPIVLVSLSAIILIFTLCLSYYWSRPQAATVVAVLVGHPDPNNHDIEVISTLIELDDGTLLTSLGELGRDGERIVIRRTGTGGFRVIGRYAGGKIDTY